ncbi:hypothetical protein [Hymenobacter chitinivorans]|uniref:Apolipoprotein N-acyltransferase n=1 Tax=Hymenobacter chitinivorans DSM 11115 TaxID=1121954 RepID=A0A2M9B5E4_9BACT|nr:hypothetical protein [Hymenobacter chitinivorans]PJJ53157.1 hypothetical protein CLV45_3815 [Hymenobacter chitinivorans DSM 11115]
MRLFLVIFVLCAVAQYFLPWWIVTPLAFAAAFGLPTSGGRAFMAGFNGVGMGWFMLAVWFNVKNEGLLASRVAQLLPLGGSSWAVVILAAVLSGLVGGLAALAGSWTRQALAPPPVAPAR